MPEPGERKPVEDTLDERRRRILANLPTDDDIRRSLSLEETVGVSKPFEPVLETNPVTGERTERLVTGVQERASRLTKQPDFQQRAQAVMKDIADIRTNLEGASPGQLAQMFGEGPKAPSLFARDREGNLKLKEGLGGLGIPQISARTGEMNMIEFGQSLIGDVGRTPFIQQVFEGVGQLGSAGTSTAAAAASLVTGDTEQASEDIRRAGRAVLGGLPFTENVGPEDLFFFGDLMDRYGVSKGGTWDLGIIGTFQTRDLVDFAGNILTDPLIMSGLRIGAPTAAGEAALKAEGRMAAGTLPGRDLLGFGQRNTARVASDLAEQMRRGERGLFSVFVPGKGRVPVRVGGSQKYIDAPIAEVYDMARRGMARSGVGRALNVKPGEQFTRPAEVAAARSADALSRQVADAETFWISVEKGAKDAGMPPEEFAHRMLIGQRKIHGQKFTLRNEGRLAEIDALISDLERQRRGLPARRDVSASPAPAAAEVIGRIEEAADGFVVHRPGEPPRGFPKGAAGAEQAEAFLREGADGLAALPVEPPLIRRSEPVTRVGKEAEEFRRLAGRAPTEQEMRGLLVGASARDVLGLPAAPPQVVPPPAPSASVPGLSSAEKGRITRQINKLRKEQRDLLSKPTSEGALMQARGLFQKYRKAGFSVDESIGAARARSLMPDVVDEFTAPFAHRFQDFFMRQFTNEVDAGLILNELTDPAQNYIHRAITPDGLALLKKNKQMGEFRKFYGDMYANASFAKKRAMQWEGMTIPEVNGWFKTHVKGWDKDFFHENPQRILANRFGKAEQPMRSSLTHQEAFKQFGRPASEALREAGWVRAEALLDENNLQAFKAVDTGPNASTLIDKELKGLADNLPQLPDNPGAWEALRKQAIDNLIDAGAIRRTQFSRPQPGGAAFSDMMVPPEVASDLRHLSKIVNDNTTPNAFWDFYRGSTQMFKEGNTSMFLGFHARNNITNGWMVWVGAASRNPVKLVRDGKDALGVMRSMSLGDGSLVVDLGNGRTITARELTQQLDNRNALGFGPTSATELGGIGLERAAHKPLWKRMFPRDVFAPDLERVGLPSGTHPAARRPGVSGFGVNIPGKARVPVAVAKAPLRAALRVGRGLGSASEDYAKIQLALNWMREGFNVDQAAAKVKKYLFDYSDLSGFEKKYMRDGAFPFYTFPRKSIPLMLETLVAQPGRFSELAHFQRALQNDDDPVSQHVVPEFLKEGIFGFNRDAEGALRIYGGIGLPIEDLNALTSMEDANDDLFSRLNPFIKGVVQQATNKDMFRDIPLDQSDLAPSVFRHLPQSVQDWMGFRKVPRNGVTVGYRMDPTLRNVWQNAPVFSAFARASSSSESFAVNQPGGPVRPGIQPDPMLRFLSGVRVRGPLNRQQEMLMLSLNTMRKVERFLEEEQAAGRVGQSGSRFFVRRDLVPATPEEKRDAEFRSLVARTKKAVKFHEMLARRFRGLTAQERAIAAGGGKRGGGR